MIGAQKIIKACAVALAVFLIFLIGSGIVAGVSFLGMMVWGDQIDTSHNGEWTVDEYADGRVLELDVNVKATSVKFQLTEEGAPVQVETNNEYIDVWQNGDKLTVSEKGHGCFGWGSRGDLIVHLRKDVVLDDVKLEMGAGALNIDELATKRLRLNLGAGKTWIGRLRVLDSADIDGGAGVIELQSSEIKDLNLKLGVGKADLHAKLTGNNRIETGVGKADLSLEGKINDYKIVVDKGIGGVTIDGSDVGDGSVTGDGRTLVDISAGVGAVEIRTTE